MTTTCGARHWFGTDPIGVYSHCVLEPGHAEREHLDKDGRWWRTTEPRAESEPRICEVLVLDTHCPGRGPTVERVPIYMFFSHPNRAIHDDGDEDEGRTERFHLVDPRELLARHRRWRGITAGRSVCGFLYPRRMVTTLRHLVDCPHCRAVMGPS